METGSNGQLVHESSSTTVAASSLPDGEHQFLISDLESAFVSPEIQCLVTPDRTIIGSLFRAEPGPPPWFQKFFVVGAEAATAQDRPENRFFVTTFDLSS